MARRLPRGIGILLFSCLGCVLLGSVLAGCTSIYQVRGLEEEPVTPGDQDKEYSFLLDELEDADPDPDPSDCKPPPEESILPGRCLPGILKDVEARSVEPFKLCESGGGRFFERCSGTCWQPPKVPHKNSGEHAEGNQASAACSKKDKCKPGPYEPPRGYRKFEAQPFKIGVLEVNRDGSLNPKQKAQVFAMLDGEAKKAREVGHNLIILLFIHGWHHGAGVCDTNLACFRRLVGGMANAFGPPDSLDKSPGAGASAGKSTAPGSGWRREPSRFVGIYFAWRGESIDKEKSLFSWLTIWNRKRVAQDIGRRGGTNLLLELDSRYRSLKTEAKNHAPPSKVLMVSAGHSLGGAMLLSALQSKLVGNVRDPAFVRGSQLYSDQPPNAMPEIVGFGDLSMLLNPAVEAARYEVFHRNLRAVLDHGWRYSSEQMPVLLAMTSTADTADRVHFPIHRLLLPAKGRKALGHYKPFRTHELESNIQRRGLDCKPPCGCPGYVAGEFLRGVGDRDEAGQRRPTSDAQEFGKRLQAELDWLDSVWKEQSKHRQPTSAEEATDVEGTAGEERNRSQRAQAKVNSCKDLFCLEADEKDRWVDNSPFWVIRTDESVIQGHNDLWDRSLQTFLASFLQAFLEIELAVKDTEDA